MLLRLAALDTIRPRVEQTIIASRVIQGSTRIRKAPRPPGTQGVPVVRSVRASAMLASSLGRASLLAAPVMLASIRQKQPRAAVSLVRPASTLLRRSRRASRSAFHVWQGAIPGGQRRRARRRVRLAQKVGTLLPVQVKPATPLVSPAARANTVLELRRRAARRAFHAPPEDTPGNFPWGTKMTRTANRARRESTRLPGPGRRTPPSVSAAMPADILLPA